MDFESVLPCAAAHLLDESLKLPSGQFRAPKRDVCRNGRTEVASQSGGRQSRGGDLDPIGRLGIGLRQLEMRKRPPEFSQSQRFAAEPGVGHRRGPSALKLHGSGFQHGPVAFTDRPLERAAVRSGRNARSWRLPTADGRSLPA